MFETMAKKGGKKQTTRRAAPGSGTPPASPPSRPPPAQAPASPVAPPAPPGGSLLRLEKPFDVDEFSELLGENRISATVPREALPEVLRRVVEFMGFGVYVYAVVVLPAPSATLEKFTVNLDRIDFDAKRGVWVPFQDKGVSSSPFGPDGKGPAPGSAPH